MNNYSSSLAFGDTVGEDGVWMQFLNPAQGFGLRPTLFLDRDGVILIEANYLHTVEKTQLIAGALETIRRANSLGLPVVVVTNQSGIGRGIYGWVEFSAVQEKMLNDLTEGDAYINAVMACPFHAEAQPPWDVGDHPDRKPNPGMLLRAERILPVDFSLSWIIGDRASDIEAGKLAGLEGGMHVLSGYGSHPGQRANARCSADDNFTVVESDSIADAMDKLALLS